MVGRVVQLADVVEHRPARGDGVGFPGDPVGGDVFKRGGGHLDAFLITRLSGSINNLTLVIRLVVNAFGLIVSGVLNKKKRVSKM